MSPWGSVFPGRQGFRKPGILKITGFFDNKSNKTWPKTYISYILSDHNLQLYKRKNHEEKSGRENKRKIISTFCEALPPLLLSLVFCEVNLLTTSTTKYLNKFFTPLITVFFFSNPHPQMVNTNLLCLFNGHQTSTLNGNGSFWKKYLSTYHPTSPKFVLQLIQDGSNLGFVGWSQHCILLAPRKKPPTSGYQNWVVVSNMFYVHPYFGEDEPILTNISQRGWFNHQLENGHPKNGDLDRESSTSPKRMYLDRSLIYKPWETHNLPLLGVLRAITHIFRA